MVRSSKHWVSRILPITIRVTRKTTYSFKYQHQYQALWWNFSNLFPTWNIQWLRIVSGSGLSVAGTVLHLRATVEFGGWFTIKKICNLGYKSWRSLGSFTLHSHLSNVADLQCSFVFLYGVVFILTVISVLSQKPLLVMVVAKKGFTTNQRKVATCSRALTELTARVCSYVRANSGGSFESLNVAAICRRMLNHFRTRPSPFYTQPQPHNCTMSKCTIWYTLYAHSSFK